MRAKRWQPGRGGRLAFQDSGPRRLAPWLQEARPNAVARDREGELYLAVAHARDALALGIEIGHFKGEFFPLAPRV